MAGGKALSFKEQGSSSGETAGMRLDGTPNNAEGKGAADLSVSAADKRAAAGYIETELGPAAVREGGQAVLASTSVFGSSNTTPGELRGWDTRKGLDFCLERWDAAWKKATNRLRSEMHALNATKVAFQNQELDRVRDFNSLLTPPSSSRLNDL
ncbi:hypothetical protein [Streptomyces spirodelae]|uniref:WXG100 family type VII secretion target n=1 Tax=Streptomyces spirodelae TaxID=2812904 RepID=A0ABS3WP19_9ACTN|nr:hypothetical protein [Streptomyces spirodelae]MBO8184612.1 hypothetical protein [Streptomyces spirodelae]